MKISIDNRNRQKDYFLFLLLLALFAWLPLPFGSNTSWAVAIMEIWVFIIAGLWIVLYIFNQVSFNHVFFAAKIPLLFFVLFVFYVFFQTIQLPLFIIDFIAPHTAAIYRDTFAVLNAQHQTASLSLNHYVTYGKFIESVCYFLLFVLVLLLVNSRARLKTLVYLLIISGVVQAVFGTLMTLSGLEYVFVIEKTHGKGVATGTFINRNHFAGYLEMCLALGIGVLVSTLHSTPANSKYEFWRRIIDVFLGNKIHLRIALAIMVIALVSSHSRMGNVAFFVSMSVMGLMYLFLVKKAPRNVIILFVSLIIIDLIIVGNWFGLDKLIDRFEKTQVSVQINNKPQGEKKITKISADDQKITRLQNKRALQVYNMEITSRSETRDEVYRDSLLMIKENPVFGTGGGTYRNSFLQYRSFDITGFYDHAHNDYLELFSEYGLAGFFMLGVVVIYSLFNALIAIRQRHSSFMQGLAFACAMGVLSLLIHSYTDFNLQIPANSAFFVLLLAMSNVVKYKQNVVKVKQTKKND